jgi:hypothetical protein
MQFYNDLLDESIFAKKLISYQISRIQMHNVIFATNLSCLELDT